MRQLRAQSTTHHIKPRPFIHKDPQTCSHVFVREDTIKKPSDAPYNGPFKIIERISDRLFTIDIKGQTTNISTERLKLAYLINLLENEQLPTSPTSTIEHQLDRILKIYPGPKAKKNVQIATTLLEGE